MLNIQSTFLIFFSLFRFLGKRSCLNKTLKCTKSQTHRTLPEYYTTQFDSQRMLCYQFVERISSLINLLSKSSFLKCQVDKRIYSVISRRSLLEVEIL